MQRSFSLFLALQLVTFILFFAGCDLLGLTGEENDSDSNLQAYVGTWGGDGDFGYGVTYQWLELSENSYLRKVAQRGDSGLTTILFREKGALSEPSSGTLSFTSSHEWNSFQDDDGEFTEDEWITVSDPEAYSFSYTVDSTSIKMRLEG